MSEPEIIDISNFDSNDTINISGPRLSTFGSGIELLMNDKKKNSMGSGGSRSGGLSSDIDVNDLNNLEDELNELSSPKKSIKNARSNMFSSSFKLNEGFDNTDDMDDDDNISIVEPLNLGASTKQQSSEEKKTWDGYGKFNDIPLNPNLDNSSAPRLNKDEMLKEKFLLLKKLICYFLSDPM